MQLTQEELEVIVNSLIFTGAGDACFSDKSFDRKAAAELAVKLARENPCKIQMKLSKLWGEYICDNSPIIEKGIPNIQIED